jgi:SAM-dependent MidA family methyltransferase
MRYPRVPCLVRDYIGQVLYTPGFGYFNAPRRIIASEAQLDFNRMRDEKEYRKHISAMYRSGSGSWTTPVEVFHPHYARAIAKWALRKHKEGKGMHFVEVGGGTGTCAVGILDFLKEDYPEIYEKSSYTIVDLSTEMNKLQKANLDAAGHVDAISCNVVSESGVSMDPKKWDFFKGKEDELCHIIALEVLDNMPHDKSRLDFAVLLF